MIVEERGEAGNVQQHEDNSGYVSIPLSGSNKPKPKPSSTNLVDEMISPLDCTTIEPIPVPVDVDNDKIIAISSQVIKVLLDLKISFPKEQQSKIENFIKLNSHLDLGALLIAMVTKDVLERSVLVAIILSNHELKKDKTISHWWQDQKNEFRYRYSKNGNAQKVKPLTKNDIKFLFSPKRKENDLIEELKKSLTTFAKENLYIYKLDKKYYFSEKPNEGGGRCDKQDRPLKDELGNDLTDEQGQFRYCIMEILQEDGEPIYNDQDEVQYILTAAVKGQPGATPLTDKNHVPLEQKYWEKVNKDKPKEISPKRVAAINQVLDLIHKASAEEIYRYVTTPTFKELVGANEATKLLKSFRVEAKHIVKKFIDDYEAMSFRISDNQLVNFILDEQEFNKITDEQLAHLFWHYNSIMIADSICLYHRNNINIPGLTFDLFHKVVNHDLAAVYEVNKIKAEKKAKLLLPADVVAPGKHGSEERLTKHQLFQYDEPTVGAAEGWLRNNFEALLINNGVVTEERTDESTRRFTVTCPNIHSLDASTPYYFYLVPTNSYMLLDPMPDFMKAAEAIKKNPLYARYLDFKSHIQFLVTDPNKSSFSKPIIFTGVINIDNNHYIPYFIYRNKRGEVFVHVVDPSPKKYPEQYQGEQDKKLKTFNRLRAIYNDIFPGCHYNDPLTTQMLREHNCGPNALQTLLDAFKSAGSLRSLLTIDDDDNLILNEQNLTLKGQPCAIDPYTGTYVYYTAVETNSDRVRNEWAQRLGAIKKIHYFQLRDNPSIIDHCELVELEYDYLTLVKAQKGYDQRNSNISDIQCILLNEDNGVRLVEQLKENYKHTLTFGRLPELIEFIKSKSSPAELEKYTSEHENNINLLMADVAAILVCDLIPEGLERSLQSQVLAKLPERTDLNAEGIVNDFLERNSAIYKKLSSSHQVTIKDRLLHQAQIAVRNKLINAYLNVFTDLIQRNCFRYLIATVSADNVQTIPELTQVFCRQFNTQTIVKFFVDHDKRLKPEQIEQAVGFLNQHAFPILKSTIEQHIHKIANIFLDGTVEFVLKKFESLNTMSMKEFLAFFNQDNGAFVAPKNTYLFDNESRPNVLRLEDSDSVLGKWLVPKIHQEINNKISAVFGEIIKAKVQLFVKETNFLADFGQPTLQELEQWLDDSNRFVIDFDFARYIQLNGKSLTSHDYKNKIAHSYVKNELLRILFEHVSKNQKKQYEQFVSLISNLNRNDLYLHNITKTFDFSSDVSSQLIDSARAAGDFNDSFRETFYVQGTDVLHPCCLRFYRHFDQHYTHKLIKNYTEAFAFEKYLLNIATLIEELSVLQNKQIDAVLHRYAVQHAIMHNKLRGVFLEDGFGNEFILIKQEFSAILKMVINDVMKIGFIRGEITPGSLTVALRPTICSLLDIIPGVVLHPTTAIVIDDLIVETLKRQTLPSAIRPKTLLSLPVVKEVPESYNRPLTIGLLIELIAFYYTNRPKFVLSLQRNAVPVLIQELVKLVNTYPTDYTLVDEDLVNLRGLVPDDLDNQLAAFNDPGLVGQIQAAILKSTGFTTKHSVVTTLSFANITELLRGGDVKSVHIKPGSERKKISEQEFNQKVSEIYAERLRTQHSKQGGKPLEIEAIKAELAKVYVVDGEPMPKTITRSEFSRLATAELQAQMKIYRQDMTKKAPNMAEIQINLHQQYRVEEDINTAEQQDQILVPRQNLQRVGLNKLRLFGDTRLDKQLMALKSRHKSQDQMDSWDIRQLELHLKMRWAGLQRKEQDRASLHYLCEKPDYVDSEYIVMAEIIANFHKAQGRAVHVYDLLMPGFFTASDKLQAHQLSTKDIDQEQSDVFDTEVSVEDIPLHCLVVTRSGYAFNIEWLVQRYIKYTNLKNPYTKENFSKEEIEDILRHPKAELLIRHVQQRCQPRVTKRCIDYLEDYIVATVFESGLSGKYTPPELKLMNHANAEFTLKMVSIPAFERDALMKELIPGNQFGKTVEQIIEDSHNKKEINKRGTSENNQPVKAALDNEEIDDPALKKFIASSHQQEKENCGTFQNSQLARVVVAYKGKNNTKFEKFILDLVGNNIEQRFFKEDEGNIKNQWSDTETLVMEVLEANPRLQANHKP